MYMDEQKFLKELGLKLKVARVIKGYTQEDLAGAVECDRSYISVIERGLQNPSITKLIKITKALNVDIKALLNDLI